MQASVFEGEREGSSIYHCGDGFYYHYNNGYEYGVNEGNAAVSYMRCIHHNTKNCHGTAKAVVTAEGLQWVNLSQHICSRDVYHERLIRLRRFILKEATRVNGPFETPTSLVDRIRTRFVCQSSYSVG